MLLQHLAADPAVDVPVYAAGGIGTHTAAAAVAGGAAGVVLDVQLALVREADPPAAVAAVLAAMDGSETKIVDGHRLLARPGTPETGPAGVDPAETGARPLPTGPWPLPVGQDGPLAASLAARYRTAGGVVQAVRAEVIEHLRAAAEAEPLAPAADPLVPDGRVYPVVQGPMTQVSDCSAFAAAVAQDGGLPFLALALKDGDAVRALLEETADRLGDRPWGVGVLGFAPPEVREAQVAAVRDVRPPYAIIAGGRPAQAAELADAGVRAYLHVPSPELLERYLREGARRFVFEGAECGGHVGPRAAFPLWDAQVERLLAFGGDASELSVMFAGGIHDERSAAMVAALSGPLAARGADVRVLMGTAYLFTTEAVAAGAIVPGFQRAALDCAGTALLETSPGHAIRCARTPYVDAFAETRRELSAVGMPRREVWRRLEELNLGRLRVASKGLRRRPSGREPQPVEPAEQRAEGLYMIGQVAALRSSTTGVTALHEQVSTGATALLAARAAELGVAADRPAAAAARPADIAIVGMACVFPGAPDAARYWANIVGGVDSVTEVPAGRWDPDLYYDPAAADGTTPSKWGGFLPDVPFDALAYGIPPAALGSVDPVQLLALEVASRALDDAGYADRPFDRSRTSVFFGAEGGNDLATAYGIRATLPAYLGEVPPGLAEQLPAPTEDSFPGVLTNVIAGRIANRLDLGGANYTVDAACAASLAALDAACKDLAAGTSDMVLCGGADVHNGIQDYLLFSSVRALSPAGRCAAFDADADGIALGEGVACVVLKRLADAERDGDRVYAVVKSVAGSSDGRSLGLTAPSAAGQRRALDRAYERAGVSPSDVGLVEAHGTGTGVGDRTELATLSAAFAGAAPGAVALGSVKSQIGHTKCAAGLAGLIKTAYALHTGVLPGTLHLAKPIPEWDPDGPFAFGRAARPWAAAPGDRYAGLSGFGFGGTNFHAVLAGYGGAPEPVSGLDEWPAELFLIRGADDTAARTEIDRLRALLATGTPRLRDLARTSAAAGGPVRAALVATGLADLRRKLDAAADGRPMDGVLPAHGEGPGQVAFLFPGQGSQRPGMLAGLFVAFPRLQRLLRLAGGRYAAAMFPPAAFTREDARRQRDALTDTRAAQPALGIAGLAVHRLLTALGVHPDLAAGHSYGELVALCAAGVFDETDMVELSAARAAAILDAAGEDRGAMAAVTASLREVREALSGVSQIVVANHNAPRQVVVSGTGEALARALGVLAERGVKAERLPVACAFHSPLVAAAAAGLRADLTGRDLRSPAFPVWSNTTAAPYDADPAELAATLAGQLAAPVRFVEQIEAMYAAGARTFVEAGPGRVLTGLVGAILGDRPHTAVACDAPGEDGLARLLAALAELAAAGVPVDPLPLFAGRDARPLTASGTAAGTATGRAGAPGWIVNGHLVRTADGGYPTNALRPAQRVPGGTMSDRPRGSEAAVLEYLRAGRELIAAQREVILRHLGASGEPSPAAPAVTASPIPAPRAVLAGETLPPRTPSAQDPADPGSGSDSGVAASVPAGSLSRDVHADVLAVISARTGYPENMLGSDLQLEADLSIDSIKRTVIIGDLADRVGLAADGRPDDALIEQLSRLTTIGEIVTWLRARLAIQDAPDASDASDAPDPDADRTSSGVYQAPVRIPPQTTPRPGQPAAHVGTSALSGGPVHETVAQDEPAQPVGDVPIYDTLTTQPQFTQPVQDVQPQPNPPIPEMHSAPTVSPAHEASHASKTQTVPDGTYTQDSADAPAAPEMHSAPIEPVTVERSVPDVSSAEGETRTHDPSLDAGYEPAQEDGTASAAPSAQGGADPLGGPSAHGRTAEVEIPVPGGEQTPGKHAAQDAPRGAEGAARGAEARSVQGGVSAREGVSLPEVSPTQGGRDALGGASAAGGLTGEGRARTPEVSRGVEGPSTRPGASAGVALPSSGRAAVRGRIVDVPLPAQDVGPAPEGAVAPSVPGEVDESGAQDTLSTQEVVPVEDATTTRDEGPGDASRAGKHSAPGGSDVEGRPGQGAGAVQEGALQAQASGFVLGAPSRPGKHSAPGGGFRQVDGGAAGAAAFGLGVNGARTSPKDVASVIAEGARRLGETGGALRRPSDVRGVPDGALDGGIVRQVVRLCRLDALPVPGEAGTAFAERRFLIVDDGCGVALELGDLLERHGATVRTPMDVDGECDGLIHLAALRPGATAVLPGVYEGIRRALLGGLRWLVVASGAGGTFGLRYDGGGVGDPTPGAGLRGMARTVAQEYPEVLVRAVDVDTKDTPRAIAQRIMAELLTAETPVSIGHEGHLRRSLTVVPAELSGTAAVPGLGPDGVVLLTGGARGITARAALAFARTSGCHVEVVGRTPEPGGAPAFPDAADEAGLRRALVAQGGRAPAEIEATIRLIMAEREIVRNLEALRGVAASVRYHAVDVRDARAVRDVVEGVYRRHGRLDGVVHGAGLVEDRLVRDKGPESFARVYRTKVDGACALAAAVRPDVGFFVVFGSVAGVHGNRGQVDYASANDACDTLAHVWRTRLRGRVLVADWGPWAGGGMVSPELAREYARRGIGLIDPDAGVAALLREIAHGTETQVVFTGTVR
ncbi:type I polyketide synthase [Actinomadura fibrosa]|uniref:type I polyketide synthase n=1 Tax=Actinomadura fibrosa TaxID=111802 RepID=UPI001A956200|nr:type I polyketide synthase [Actinomadura fibrosa]